MIPPSASDLIQLILSMKVERLQELHIKTICKPYLKLFYENVIERLGIGIEKLTLWSEINVFANTWCQCSRKDTLDEEQVSKILKKCLNLKELSINGRHLSLDYLMELERSHNLTLITEQVHFRNSLLNTEHGFFTLVV